MTLNSISHHGSTSGVFPALVFVQGSEQKNIVLNHIPFNVGRKVDKDLVIADPRVSRDHAQIMQEGQDFFLVDLGSKHGTAITGCRCFWTPAQIAVWYILPSAMFWERMKSPA